MTPQTMGNIEDYHPSASVAASSTGPRVRDRECVERRGVAVEPQVHAAAVSLQILGEVTAVQADNLMARPRAGAGRNRCW